MTSVYLDCNATTPIEPSVADMVMHFLKVEYGNAGSRTHGRGVLAKRAVELARKQVAALLGAAPEEVVFTSGATESNNLALLGSAAALDVGLEPHCVTTAIEHKAVLEPAESLRKRKWNVTVVPAEPSGRVSPESVLSAVNANTRLVSVMHANNETGVLQPIAEIARDLPESCVFHVDAAQTFGKELEELANPRLDMISFSGHKIYGPKGIGGLIVRRRDRRRPPLAPMFLGGGQERGLRPGTLPVALIAGLGEAARLAVETHSQRRQRCLELRDQALVAFKDLPMRVNGDMNQSQPHVLNLSFAGIDSEAAMLAWKGIADVSNGSACTSSTYSPSHVLAAMGLNESRIDEALRLSWCHLTPDVDWAELAGALRKLL